MTQTAFAIFAHPDDIELVAAGTLLLLKRAGWDIHYMNLSCGDLGSMTNNASDAARIRLGEAQNAAQILGATWHAPLAHDLDIFYEREPLKQLAAIVREVNPQIVFTHSPVDYMEDHVNTARLVTTAVFGRGMPNFVTQPPMPPVAGQCALYHAQPHLNRDPLGQIVQPELFVDVGEVMSQKRAALAAHKSQKSWLDQTQGMDSYLQTMQDLMREVGNMSGHFEYAEGWRRHLYAGFCSENSDPLSEVLQELVQKNPRYA